MIKIPENLYFVADVSERIWGDKTYTDILLRHRAVVNDKEYDTFIPCQMAYKSTAPVPKQYSIIRCELDITSREKDGRYYVSFGIYNYKVENAPATQVEPQPEPEPFDDINDIGF